MTWKCVPFQQLTIEELYATMRLRQEVFVVEQNCVYLDADGLDQASWHLMAFNENKDLVAYARLIPKGVSYADAISFGRVLTASSIRKQGKGRVLLKRILEYCESIFGEETIIIGAQSYLLNFYKSFAFQAIGDEYLEDGIPHFKMKLSK